MNAESASRIAKASLRAASQSDSRNHGAPATAAQSAPTPDPPTHPDQPQPRGRWSTCSATDAVADVCGLRRVDHPNDLQLDARRQHLEQPTATTEQHRDLVDLQLVTAPRPRAPAAPCTRQALARCGLRLRPSPVPSRWRSHRSRRSPTDSSRRTGRAAGGWV